MYDYAYAYSSSIPSIGSHTEYTWIIQGNSPIQTYANYNEWLMHDYYDTYAGNRAITINDMTGANKVNEIFAVRPVFFVDKNETLNGGTGSIDDPFLIVE